MSNDLLVPRTGAPGPWSYVLPGVGGALAWLHEHGCRAGDRVCVSAPNSPGFASLLQAAALAGLELVLIHHRQPDAARAAQAAAAGGRVLPPIPTVFAEAPLPTSSASGGALLLHTSGTTGTPRRVRLPWDRVHAACQAAADHLALHPGETWLACLPLDHAGGVALILRAACAGTPLVLRRFDAADLANVDAASLVPTLLHRVVAETVALPQRPRLVIGGAPLGDGLARAARARGARVLRTYGLTETCAMLACQRDDSDAVAMPVIAGWDIRITDASTDGIGTISVRGPGRCAGYDETMDPADAWLSTGDLGRFDAHLQILTVIGRTDDVFISGGEKISPAAVEAVLLGHPAIAEVAVHPRPDAAWGHLPVATAVANGPIPDPVALDAWCQDHLAPHQRPRQWSWVAVLPRNALGKLLRHQLG